MDRVMDRVIDDRVVAGSRSVQRPEARHLVVMVMMVPAAVAPAAVAPCAGVAVVLLVVSVSIALVMAPVTVSEDCTAAKSDQQSERAARDNAQERLPA